MARKSKRWSYRAGRRPYTVTVEELEPGGNLYSRVWVRAKQDYRYKSLGHRDRKEAMEYADRMALQRRDSNGDASAEKLTLGRLFELYLENRTPQKTLSTQREDHRKAELFLRVFGVTKDPTKLGRAEWEQFVMARLSGSIDSRGRKVPVKHRRSIRTRTAEADLRWLRAVFGWGTTWQTSAGKYLLSEDPTRGLKIPKEQNPRRAIATQDRLERIRAVSDRILMEDHTSGSRRWRRSYLTELLDVVNGTGRRISAVCQLRYDDLRLDDGPYGAIRWRADTDKMGYESTVPIGPEVRSAIDRILQERPSSGGAYLFPSPRVEGAPIRYEAAGGWLRKAEKLAGVEKQDGALWHAYRRKWATERKHLPDVDVAAAGGWKSPATLVAIYQRPDANTMLRVVLEGGELRERPT